jgi:hypothetical protein
VSAATAPAVEHLEVLREWYTADELNQRLIGALRMLLECERHSDEEYYAERYAWQLLREAESASLHSGQVLGQIDGWIGPETHRPGLLLVIRNRITEPPLMDDEPTKSAPQRVRVTVEVLDD